MAPVHALEINSVGMAVFVPVMIAMGWLSDHVGRKPLWLLALFLGLFGAFPLLRLMHHTNPTLIILGQLGFSLILGTFFGALPSAMVEAVPAQVRCSALSLGFNVTSGIVGGLTPLVAAWLVHRTAAHCRPAPSTTRTGQGSPASRGASTSTPPDNVNPRGAQPGSSNAAAPLPGWPQRRLAGPASSSFLGCGRSRFFM